MTRINAGIHPSRLIDQHLIAEYKELPRALTLAILAITRWHEFDTTQQWVEAEGIPTEYRLGTGHVKFFYNKLPYLYSRYLSLLKEMSRRDINYNRDIAGSVVGCFEAYQDHLTQVKWEPVKDEFTTTAKRLASVIKKRMKREPIYNKQKISRIKAVKIIYGV